MALEYGAKQEQYMRKNIVYTDAPADIDFSTLVAVDPRTLGLPTPKQVAEMIKGEKRRTRKVTIALDQGSIDFFRDQANLHKTKYQTMIKTLLNEYVSQAQKPSVTK